MKTKIIILIYFVLSVFKGNAQTEPTMSPIEFLLDEKVKFTPQQVEAIMKARLDTTNKINNELPKKPAEPTTVTETTDRKIYDYTGPESEIHGAIDPTNPNNIVVSPIRMQSNASIPAETVTTPVYYSTNMGLSWKASTFVNRQNKANAFVIGGGDPVLAYSKSGILYLSWINLFYTMIGSNIDSTFNTMSWAWSDDNGVSWTRESNEIIGKSSIKGSNTNALSSFYDKQWMAVDQSESPFKGSLYATLTRLYSNQTASEILFYKKRVTEKSFSSAPVRISTSNYKMVQFSNIDVDNAGNIHVIFYANNNNVNGIYYAVSKDGGVTFSKEKLVSTFKFSGSQMIPSESQTAFTGLSSRRLYPCPQLAVDKSSKSGSPMVYVAWTAIGITSNENKKLNVYLSASNDFGQTWSKAVRVNNDSTSTCQYYPSISVNPKGVLVIGFYDRSNDLSDRLTNYCIAVSHDQGTTFDKIQKVSSASMDFSYIGLKNSQFGIGEYCVLMTSDDYAMPVWSDGRTNDGDINPYIAVVPLSTDSVIRISPISSDFELGLPYPNSATDLMFVKITNKSDVNAYMDIIDIAGKTNYKVWDGPLYKGDNVQTIDVSYLAQGHYFLRLIINGQLAIRPFEVIRD